MLIRRLWIKTGEHFMLNIKIWSRTSVGITTCVPECPTILEEGLLLWDLIDLTFIHKMV